MKVLERIKYVSQIRVADSKMHDWGLWGVLWCTKGFQLAKSCFEAGNVCFSSSMLQVDRQMPLYTAVLVWLKVCVRRLMQANA